MNRGNDNNLELKEIIGVIDKLNSILASEQTLNECISLCRLTRLPLRLQVWAQDYKYQLNRLESIKEDLAKQARTKCGLSSEGHEWVQDHIETRNGEEMKKITYCSRCEAMK